MLKTKFCIRRRMLLVLLRAWEKKFLVPIRIRTLELRISRSDALPLSHRDGERGLLRSSTDKRPACILQALNSFFMSTVATTLF